MSLKHHAMVQLYQLHEMGINPSSKYGVKLRQTSDLIITVKKDNGVLRWKDLEIAPKWIKEVIEGDILEYFL